MERAKCKKGLSVEKCDGDGFTIPNKYVSIKEGTVWDINEDKYRIVGGEVKLTNGKLGWLEISKEHFEEHFEPII